MSRRLVKQRKLIGGGKIRGSAARYSYHGDKAGICYRTEVGAKSHGLRGDGVLIVQSTGGFFSRFDESRVYDDEKIIAVRRDGKWAKYEPWTKNNRNKWTWNEDPEFTVEIYKYDGIRFYGADVWWKGHTAEIDGAPTRGDIEYLVQEFLRNENPRKYFEHNKRFVLEDIGYKKED